MRYTLTIFLFMLCLVSKGQKFELGTGYVFSVPRGSMQSNIQYANGFNIDFHFTPGEKRYSFGMEMNVNMYGHDKTRQTYILDDGSSAPMDIIVNNNFYNVMLTGRYFLMNGKIKPFITGKVGYSFFNTDLSIYDPDDMDHCEPVENNVLSRDGTIIFSAGAGLRWELLPKKTPGLLFMNLAANYSAGGKVNYMNVDGPSHSHTAHTSDVYVKFINTQTQIVHDHHVGNVYSSPLELMDFRLSVSIMLGRR